MMSGRFSIRVKGAKDDLPRKLKNVQKKAASQATHKTLRMIEDEFEIKIDKAD
jgi:hypothetical protein